MWPHTGHSPARLLSAWHRGDDLFLDWPQFSGRINVFTHLSRVGIAMAFRLLHLSDGDEILAPSYNCGSELDPLLKCGADVVFYRVDSRTRIDFDDVRRRLTPRTRALYVTHYFGWPQPLTEISQWCREHNLLLIEDCALSLLSRGPDGPIGLAGDAAIHCLWKTLPVPDGGALSLPAELLIDDEIGEMVPPEFRSACSRTWPFLRRWMANCCKRFRMRFHPRPARRDDTFADVVDLQAGAENEPHPPHIPPYCYFDERMRKWRTSRLTRGLLAAVEPDQVVESRRRNYSRLLDRIGDSPGLRPLFEDLPDGVCPQVFPAFVSSPTAWQRLLYERGVHSYAWWRSYHPAFSWEEFPEAAALKNHILAFPVHQHLEDGHIEHTIQKVREVASGIV